MCFFSMIGMLFKNITFTINKRGLRVDYKYDCQYEDFF